MDNTEYIKSLEERIDALEKQLQAVIAEKSSHVSIENCTLQGISFDKCKAVTFKNNTIADMALSGTNCKLVKSTVQNLDSKNAKTKISHCTIENLCGK